MDRGSNNSIIFRSPFFALFISTSLLHPKSRNKHGATNRKKNSNPNELSQSDNPFIFNNWNVTCQAQPDDLSREGAFVVC